MSLETISCPGGQCTDLAPIKQLLVFAHTPNRTWSTHLPLRPSHRRDVSNFAPDSKEVMRRVAVRAFRACQSNVRSHRALSYGLSLPLLLPLPLPLPHLRVTRRGSLHLYNSTVHTKSNNTRLFSTSLSMSSSLRSPAEHALKRTTQSPMNVRRLAAALGSGLVGYGAWYTYSGNSTDAHQELARGYAGSSASISTDNAVPTRSILVIGADELQTATIVGEGPISKTTDDNDRTVVEMLTPDQSTQKLRKMEESYIVNRGRGVLRYDVVQLPSNNPIEDDHAEKIVDWPHIAGAGPDSGSDWMFWGVYDGHSYVEPTQRHTIYPCCDSSKHVLTNIDSQGLDNLCQAPPEPD